MRKEKKKRLYRLKAAALIAAVAAVPAASMVPAYAVAENPVTEINGKTTTFDKYLLMNKNANVPNATFSYTVSIPTDDDMISLANPEDTNGTNLTVRKGIGTPTASDTVFKAGDQTFDSTQDAAKNDQVAGLDTTEKYAKHTSTVDFSNVTFREPGVYRYKITEKIPGDNEKEKGVTYNPTSRFLDVYVESDDAGNLSIKGYVFHSGNDAQKKDGANPAGKNEGFTNTYTTNDLTLTKNVTGNQGFRDQYFKFHVDITNLDANARLFVTDSNGYRNTYTSKDTVAYAYDASTGKRTTGQNRFVATEGKGTFADIAKGSDDDKGLTVTANDQGAISFDVYLKHGESVKLNGLTKGAQYKITETSEDYTATATKASGAETAADIKLVHTAHTDATPDETLGANNGLYKQP